MGKANFGVSDLVRSSVDCLAFVKDSSQPKAVLKPRIASKRGFGNFAFFGKHKRKWGRIQNLVNVTQLQLAAALRCR